MVAPNEKINFTKQTLNALPLPDKGKRYAFKDAKERGLIIRVMASGVKTFQLYQKHQGRPLRISLGTFPDMTIEQARREAAKAKGALASGTNPNIEKNRVRKEITLKELFSTYMERYSKVEKKSWKYDEREINKYLPHWFNRKVSDISKHEIALLHGKIRDNNGLYQANRILERLRAMYNKAIEWGWEGTNPTLGIKKFKEKSRDRFIQPDEMPLLIEALEAEQNEVARDYLFVSLFTGARKSNVLKMRWDEIDWNNKTWRIPESKNGEPVIIPLTDQAEMVLLRRKIADQGSPWAFPSPTSKEGHLADPKKAWQRVKENATILIWKKEKSLASLIDEMEQKAKAETYGSRLFLLITKEAQSREVHLPSGMMDIRIHDIRRTFGSYQAITGASLQIIGKSLGHKSQAATQVYSRLHNDPVRAAANKATRAMLTTKEAEK